MACNMGCGAEFTKGSCVVPGGQTLFRAVNKRSVDGREQPLPGTALDLGNTFEPQHFLPVE